jgi:hypothetical protein
MNPIGLGYSKESNNSKSTHQFGGFFICYISNNFVRKVACISQNFLPYLYCKINNKDMIEHKRTNEKVWIDGLGYCVEVTHTNVNGSYTSYTPIKN